MNTLSPSPWLSTFGINSRRPSPVNEMTGSFASDFREGYDINLGVGYVNDETIPGEMIRRALSEVLADPKQYRNALNYGSAEGSPSLRSALRHYYLNNDTGTLTSDDFNSLEITIGANGATSILDSFAEIIEPGIVITADPYYYIYCDTLQRKGFEIITVPEDDQGMRIDLLQMTLQNIDISRLRFFYIVTVNNPTGTILANTRKQRIIELAGEYSQKKQRLIPVLFDKAYEDIIHDPAAEKPVSGLKYDSAELVCEIGTFSKVIAPALRIGYMLTRNRELSKLIAQKASDIGFSAPLMNQEITAWILTRFADTQRRRVNEGYREKATRIRSFLYRTLGDDLRDLKGGSAGFYYYLTLPVPTGRESSFFSYLSRSTGIPELDGQPEKKPRLVYIPGEYCVNRNGSMKAIGNRQLRISYGFETIEHIEQAAILIKEAIDYSKRC